MKNPAEKFLPDSVRKSIEARIAEAEKRTSGEIVVMVVPSSYHYPLATMTGSLLVALLAALGVTFFASEVILFERDESRWLFPAGFSISFMVLHEVVKRTPFQKRLFVKPSDMKEEVEEAAVYSFYQRGINLTAEHTGILIYISLFERSVRVIADQGINDKVKQEIWQEIVTTIVGGFQQKEHAKAIAAAIDRCGEILAAHFPLKPGDRNELGNEVIIGR